MQKWVHNEYSLEENRIVSGDIPQEELDREKHSYALALVAATANK